jgi:hypothetical protein
MLTMETDDSGIVLIRASGRLSKADYDSCRSSSASPGRAGRCAY